jgi:hypothetical protein
MAYDRELAHRIREVVQQEPGLSERPMFGGLAFMIDGNLAVSAGGRGGLMLRVDPADTQHLVAQPHVSRMVMRGREMNGWLRVEPAGLESDQDLARWVGVGVSYARSLPAK